LGIGTILFIMIVITYKFKYVSIFLP